MISFLLYIYVQIEHALEHTCNIALVQQNQGTFFISLTAAQQSVLYTHADTHSTQTLAMTYVQTVLTGNR